MANADMKDIKRRIKSVESTMQITKAMELVASSKLRRAKEKTEKAMPYFNTLFDTMCEISAENKTFASIYTKKKKVNNVLLIVIAGDRGFAGGFNSNVLKKAQSRYDKLKEKGNAIIMPIGRKASEYFGGNGYEILMAYEHVSEHLSIYKAFEISSKIIDAFKSNKIDKVELVFTNYISQLVQHTRHMCILPIEPIDESKIVKNQTTYEPSAEAVFDSIIPQYITGILYGAIIDSFTAEQASRRIAMENASDNATEMIDNLSLIYNRARQTSITQEITEIVGGSNAKS